MGICVNELLLFYYPTRLNVIVVTMVVTEMESSDLDRETKTKRFGHRHSKIDLRATKQGSDFEIGCPACFSKKGFFRGRCASH